MPEPERRIRAYFRLCDYNWECYFIEFLLEEIISIESVEKDEKRYETGAKKDYGWRRVSGMLTTAANDCRLRAYLRECVL